MYRFYLQAAEADEEVEARAKYLAMLQLSDPGQLCYWPSTVAASIVILASLEGNDESRQQVMDVRTNITSNYIKMPVGIV